MYHVIVYNVIVPIHYRYLVTILSFCGYTFLNYNKKKIYAINH